MRASSSSFIALIPSATPRIRSCLFSGSLGMICARRVKISFSLFVIVLTPFWLFRCALLRLSCILSPFCCIVNYFFTT
nr:MAG TPA: hypothetical protein [Caudoviricetes sp.]